MNVDEHDIPWFLVMNCFPSLNLLTGEEDHLHSSYMGPMAAPAGMCAADVYGVILDVVRDRFNC